MWTGRWLTNRYKQPKYPAILGCIFVPIAVGLLSAAIAADSQAQLNGYLYFTGLGIGLTFAPLVLQARFCQPASRVATVVSMNMFVCPLPWFRARIRWIDLGFGSSVPQEERLASPSSLPYSNPKSRRILKSSATHQVGYRKPKCQLWGLCQVDPLKASKPF